MVNPVTSAQDHSKQAIQIEEQRQQQSQPAARPSREQTETNRLLVNNQTQTTENNASEVKASTETRPTPQPSKPNTYSSIDIRA
jgi:hypothetical protein